MPKLTITIESDTANKEDLTELRDTLLKVCELTELSLSLFCKSSIDTRVCPGHPAIGPGQTGYYCDGSCLPQEEING